MASKGRAVLLFLICALPSIAKCSNPSAKEHSGARNRQNVPDISVLQESGPHAGEDGVEHEPSSKPDEDADNEELEIFTAPEAVAMRWATL